MLAQHEALPHAVAAIEISLARIADVQSGPAAHPEGAMLQDMETLPNSEIHWKMITPDERALLRDVALRLAGADWGYTTEFNADGHPLSDYDASAVIMAAEESAAATDEPASRALQEIYAAWPSLLAD